MTQVHSLVGKFVFITSEEYYRYGKIVEQVDDELFLVQITPPDPLLIYSYGLYHIEQMLQNDANRIIGWQFFKTKADLKKYIKYIETPTENPENKVLQLVKKNEAKIT